MIFLYMAAAVGISIYDIRYLKKKSLKRDIIACVCCMLVAAAVGAIYLLNESQGSLAGYIFGILNIRE